MWNSELFISILKKDKTNINIQDKNGDTLLILAVKEYMELSKDMKFIIDVMHRNNVYHVIKYLFDNGVNIDLKNDSNESFYSLVDKCEDLLSFVK